MVYNIYNMKNREFVYRKKPTGRLATYFPRLRNHVEGAAVDTHRRLEVERAPLPVSLWEKP